MAKKKDFGKLGKSIQLDARDLLSVSMWKKRATCRSATTLRAKRRIFFKYLCVRKNANNCAHGGGLIFKATIQTIQIKT